MKHIKLPSRKSSAQAIVEFAIALPVLLLIVYGIVETGRYLFLYSTVVNASRQGVRYASATGIGDGGIPGNNAGIPRYQDCDGIRAATNRGAYIATFDSIAIEWDGGPADTTPTSYCAGSVDTSLNTGILSDNEHRVRVTVQEQYTPLVPNLVPFVARPIIATSSRTVLLSVSIEVTTAPILIPVTPTIPATATIEATNTPKKQTPTATDTPTFTPTKTNTPITHTPTMTFTPSPTFTPSNTPTPSYTPTPSFTPTPSSTPIACSALSHGPEVIAGANLSMTIDNQTAHELKIKEITVFWDHSDGHKIGSDKTLRLLSATLGTQFWTGNIYSTQYTIYPSDLKLPTGGSTITFTFHQTYTKDSPEPRILITFETNGCQGNPIDSDR